MIAKIRAWFAQRRQKKLQWYYDTGLLFGRTALKNGTHTVQELEAMSTGWVERSEYHQQFDRGIWAAIKEVDNVD